AELGIGADVRVVLIVGGAWGVGNLHQAARAVAATAGTHAITVTGHNQPLYDTMASDPRLGRITLLAYTSRIPDLMAASDVLLQNAGGLTCLEAFAAGLPVVMFDPLPGHGEDNADLMTKAGLTTTLHDVPSLQNLLASHGFWETRAPALATQSRTLFDRPSAGTAINDLQTKAVRQRSAVRRLAPIAAVALLLGGWFVAENPPHTYATPRQAPAASYQSRQSPQALATPNEPPRARRLPSKP
ncbi:MAG: glycosyltransferase, partial [Solirubrobacteraceae bacterium]